MFDSKRSRWRKLDNAALIFPATRSRRDTRVFRFYCELNEEIQEELLQEALDRALVQYPVFLSVMRKGLFWFYMEKTEQKALVHREEKPPCSHIYIPDRKSLLFQVSYYKNRINLEVFHVLTDGTGATQFIREIVKYYILLAHSRENLPDIPLMDESITAKDQEDDSFSRYYENTTRTRGRKERAFQISRKYADPYELQLTEWVLPVDQVLGKARELKVSMTVFLTTVFLCAIGQEMTRRQRRKPVRLMIPINLRNYFPSQSMLNFFGWLTAGYKFAPDTIDFQEVLVSVKECFEKELSKERVAQRMNVFTGLEKHPILRMTPLEMKNIFLQAGSNFTTSELTAVFSNMSVVKMPQEYVPYIHQFGVYTSTDKTELCMCSFQNRLALGFTSRQDSKNIERNFLQILADMGIKSTQTEEKEKYPPQEKKELKISFMQWLTFFCVAVAVAGFMVNLILTPKFPWIWYLVGAVATLWFLTGMGFYKRRNLLKNGMWQLVLGSLVAVVWDVMTGWHGWSVDFFIPGLVMLIQLLMVAIATVRKLKPQEYMIYYVMAAAFGLIPLVFVLTGLAGHTLVCVIASGVSALFLAALVIFKHKEFIYELKKKFYI